MEAGRSDECCDVEYGADPQVTGIGPKTVDSAMLEKALVGWGHLRVVLYKQVDVLWQFGQTSFCAESRAVGNVADLDLEPVRAKVCLATQKEELQQDIEVDLKAEEISVIVKQLPLWGLRVVLLFWDLLCTCMRGRALASIGCAALAARFAGGCEGGDPFLVAKAATPECREGALHVERGGVVHMAVGLGKLDILEKSKVEGRILAQEARANAAHRSLDSHEGAVLTSTRTGILEHRQIDEAL